MSGPILCEVMILPDETRASALTARQLVDGSYGYFYGIKVLLQ